MEKSFTFLFSPQINEYDFGEGHPFHNRKGEEFLNFFTQNVKMNLPILRCEPVTDRELGMICTENYIKFTKRFFQKPSFLDHIPPDFFKYHSMDNLPGKNAKNIEMACRHIVGQAKMSADLICNGKAEIAVSIGGGLHHAKRNFGEGFCIYNDVAFCGLYLLKKYKIERILILDTDAHGGNGTMEYFYDDNRVLFIDIHQDPRTLYPGTGFIHQIGNKGGKGFTVNIPLPPHSGDLCYEFVFQEIVFPIVAKFKPQVIIRNGGSDPHFLDPLANLSLTEKGFLFIGQSLYQMIKENKAREIDLIASGYNLQTLSRCWGALLSGLLNIRWEISEKKEFEEPIGKVKEVITEIKKVLRPYWFS